MDVEQPKDAPDSNQKPLIHPTRSFLTYLTSNPASIAHPIRACLMNKPIWPPSILSIIPLHTTYAISFSAPSPEIPLFDITTLRFVRKFQGHLEGVTSLKSVSGPALGLESAFGVLVSTGREGFARVWDPRVQSERCSVSLANPLSRTSLLSLAIIPPSSSNARALIAAGSSLHHSRTIGPTASIVYWDVRQPSFPLHLHDSTHSEDITSLSCAPPSSSPPGSNNQDGSQRLLLSASTDGLLALSNPHEKDPDEAVKRVGDWGCRISKAGWIYGEDNTARIWAASDMEAFSLWSDELEMLSNTDIRAPQLHLRSKLADKKKRTRWKTDYMITAHSSMTSNPKLGVWVGNKSGDIALLSTSSCQPSKEEATDPKWYIHRTFRRGHKGVLRSLFWDERNRLIVTGGEDAKLHVWPMPPLPPLPPLPSSDSDSDSESGVDDGTDDTLLAEFGIEYNTENPDENIKDEDEMDIYVAPPPPPPQAVPVPVQLQVPVPVGKDVDSGMTALGVPPISTTSTIPPTPSNSIPPILAPSGPGLSNNEKEREKEQPNPTSESHWERDPDPISASNPTPTPTPSQRQDNKNESKEHNIRSRKAYMEDDEDDEDEIRRRREIREGKRTVNAPNLNPNPSPRQDNKDESKEHNMRSRKAYMEDDEDDEDEIRRRREIREGKRRQR